MKLSYYPGCTLKTKAKNLEASAIAAMVALGVELVELPRWNCCGTVYPFAEDDLLHHLASARNLIRVREQGENKVVTLCAFCYNTLKRVNLVMQNDEEKRNTINTFMYEESDYVGDVEVVHLLEVLRDDIGWENISSKVKMPLKDLRVAPYYGCTLHRPTEADIEPPQNPSVLPELLSALGADAVSFPEANTCCGSYQIVGNPDIVLNRVRDILTSAQAGSAEVLAISCPLCDVNLGKKQKELQEKENFTEIPVVYFTQLMALSLGLDPEVCHFDSNYIDPRPLLQRKGLLPVPTGAGG